MSGRRDRDDRGAIAVLTALVSVVLLVMAGFAVDIGNTWARRGQLQVQADRATFVAYARAMQGAALGALKAIEARDAAALLESGGNIDEACELCHKKFWYPGGGVPAL